MAGKLVTLTRLGVQTGTDRTMYVTWTFTAPTVEKKKRNAASYDVQWQYATGDGFWYDAGTSSVTVQQSTYSAPTNAKKVRVRVKPVAGTRKVNKKDTPWWTGSWSTYLKYKFVEEKTPAKPSTPTVSISGSTLTATVDNYDTNTSYIEFEVVKDNTSIISSGIARLDTNRATFICGVATGGEYKVRCRGVRE